MELLNQLLAIDPNYILIGMMVLFFSLEQITETPFKFDKRLSHLLQNIPFQILLLGLNIFYVTFQVFCIEWFNEMELGLFFYVELPFWIKLFLGFMLYDFTAYWIHRATHKVPLLWRLHRVHHSDTSMDSSTVLRFHPLEPLLVFGIGNIITALVFGTDLLSLGLYYFVLNGFFFLQHSNLNYPKWLNSTMGQVFVTPDQHRVHHQQDQFYTDSNYADIFILWDKFFGTYKRMDRENMLFGLSEFDEKEKQTFLYLIKSPFLDISRITSSKSKRD